ncbi:WYL domain-containing protein [Nocardioides sp. ChNu-153]|uniref:helix-turn-helix transcriptional regulator n=1 Tax=unclassified Nocardioides TaxID=2615069 RepID=UPI002406A123|nr:MULTISPECIES: WYL domain-containing protein [unclassified Nocardioides]MDF9717405.1 WYL domain-containing protein [Nocardioides sp. ChNu-99]MDN7122209.1 WYL domain-containing protein [Nocardioides sp. ChNu-153]
MSANRSERLMKLLIMLLVQRTHVPKERIRAELYPDAGDDAFEKMFERDKEELRSLGVPLEVGQRDVLFEDEPGYLVRPGDFALPDVVLDPDEAAVLGVATQVWESARLADATLAGVRKLSAAGVPVPLEGQRHDGADLGISPPRLGAAEPAFDVLVEAVHVRCEVVFDYRGTKDDAPVERHLQPWGLVRHGGRWYVVGRDVDRQEERVFRLSRIVGEARMTGRRDAFVPPEGVDVGEVARRLAPPPPTGVPAVLLVRPGTGFALRRDAVEVTPGVPGPDGATWDRVRLEGSGPSVVEAVLEHGPDVVVEEPARLRDEVVRRLEALLDGLGVAPRRGTP